VDCQQIGRREIDKKKNENVTQKMTSEEERDFFNRKMRMRPALDRLFHHER
jgi:hypothetical protein